MFTQLPVVFYPEKCIVKKPMMITIPVENRIVLGKKVKTLRAAGKIPAVVYGKKSASRSITISTLDFIKAWKEAGESTVLGLRDEKGGVIQSLIHDVDVDPMTGLPRHADFYVFEKGQKVQVAVPLEFIGVSPAVKERGAMLVKVLHELEIEADPTKLPPHIEVDISSLKDFDSQITVGDLVLPEGVSAVLSSEDVVALTAEAKEEVIEETAPEGPDLTKIEVEKKGKQEAPGESEAAEGAAK